MDNEERPEDKKSRISFLLILAALLAGVGYLNHGRMRQFGSPSSTSSSPNSYLSKMGFMGVIACLVVSFYVWWANKRDLK